MLQTLDNFIKTQSRNAYVRSAGFESLYVRFGQRYINGIIHPCVLDIANVTAKKPGNGAFSRLVKDLHNRGITLYVESVMTNRFATKLSRMGFTKEPNREPPSFYLLAEKNNVS